MHERCFLRLGHHADGIATRILAVCLALALVVTISRSARAEDDFTVTTTTAPSGPEVRAMNCVPLVREMETRRALPFMCQADFPVEEMELRYRIEGGSKKWEKIKMKRVDTRFTATIPCTETERRGTLKWYVFARNKKRKVVARMGRNTGPFTVALVDSTKEAPPALPEQEPADRCFSKSECPPEMMGTSACPGTQAPKATKRAWGASCNESSQCQSGLACVAGSCEQPPKCETTEECPTGGECQDGVCYFPTQEEIDSRLGPPKNHWFGLHFAVDLASVRDAVGVCSASTEDGKAWDCFKGGESYAGTPVALDAGNVGSTFALATMRVLLSYDYFFKRFGFGGRVGWAFGGSPKGFSPIHIEARALYSITGDPLNSRFRPYLGLSAGYAQVDPSVTVTIADCIDPADAACENLSDQASIEAAILGDPANGIAPSVIRREFDAYKKGDRIFFGPTLMLMYALSNEAGIVLNINTMFPAIVFQPSLGYVMGI